MLVFKDIFHDISLQLHTGAPTRRLLGESDGPETGASTSGGCRTASLAGLTSGFSLGCSRRYLSRSMYMTIMKHIVFFLKFPILDEVV